MPTEALPGIPRAKIKENRKTEDHASDSLSEASQKSPAKGGATHGLVI